MADPAAPSEDELRAAVARAASGGAVDDVTVHETHISRVLVAGERAYKLKKPVRLPFVDYGDRHRRRELCHAEVRLNRRLAPDLYLGVRALARRADGTLELAAEDDPEAVDYAVEMRRFDERRTLLALLERGELVDAQLSALARVLARFHAVAPAVAPGEHPARAVERLLSSNMHELIALLHDRGAVARVQALERFAHAFVDARAATLEARARAGRTREGHGDLRAEHVLLDEVGEPEDAAADRHDAGVVRGDRGGAGVAIVDCVEFDRALRELDVADDLAFLVMDLTIRGGARAAEALVDGYRAAGGDPGDDALIALYAAHRALVRAKVALLRAGQHEPGSAARGGRAGRAEDLIALAERFAWRARLPLAIVVCGLPASGKSRLARALAGRAGLPVLGSDETRKRLLGIAPGERAPQSAYGPEPDRRTYAELGRSAALAVAERGGALVDATFRRRADRDAFAAAFGAAATALYVECVAPAPVLLERAAARERERGRVSDADRAVVERQLGSWEPLDEVAPEAHVALRSDRPVAAALADLEALLDERLARVASAG